MAREIILLAAGTPKGYQWGGKMLRSGIGKTKARELILTKNGILGDEAADQGSHGGPDRVLCLYPYEHYAYWAREFGKELPLPAFGENITATGMTEQELYIGDVFEIGEAQVQLTQGRVPCGTISLYNGERDFLTRVFETGLTGCFFKVLKEGTIRLDSPITLLDRDPGSVTVALANDVLFHSRDRALIEQILCIKALSAEWRERFNHLI